MQGLLFHRVQPAIRASHQSEGRLTHSRCAAHHRIVELHARRQAGAGQHHTIRQPDAPPHPRIVTHRHNTAGLNTGTPAAAGEHRIEQPAATTPLLMRQLHGRVGGKILRRRAQVRPEDVVAGHAPHHRAFRHRRRISWRHGGKDLALGQKIQNPFGEQVQTGKGEQIRLAGARTGQIEDAAFLHLDRLRSAMWNQPQRSQRMMPRKIGQQRFRIQIGGDIGIEHPERFILRQEPRRADQRTAGAEQDRLEGKLHLQIAARMQGEMGADRIGTVMQIDQHLAHAEPRQCIQRPVEQGAPPQRQQRLGHFARQRQETRAKAGGQQDSLGWTAVFHAARLAGRRLISKTGETNPTISIAT